jgi:membrane fusion protein (multidrug efflux system)
MTVAIERTLSDPERPAVLEQPHRGSARALFVLASLTMTVAALTGCGAGGDSAAASDARKADEKAAAEDAIAVDVALVAQDDISSLYETSATLRAERRATVIARTPGVIEQLLVEEGDTVTAEQPLARLEDDEQRYQHQIAVTARETTAREHERAKSLMEQGLVSPEEYDAKRRAAEEAEHQAALAELTLSRTMIRAPFAGRILVRHLDIGATVSNGTAIYDLADLDPLYADVRVPERHVTGLAPSQRVRLVADATGQEVDALIERIGHEVDPESGTVKVTLTVTDTAALRPGAFVRVEIVTETHTDALIVPRAALVSEGSRWSVFRLAEEGDRVERIDVTPGFEERNRVEVTMKPAPDTPPAAELQPGDPVVIAGASALTDGASVRLISEAAGASDSAGQPVGDSPGAANG